MPLYYCYSVLIQTVVCCVFRYSWSHHYPAQIRRQLVDWNLMVVSHEIVASVEVERHLMAEGMTGWQPVVLMIQMLRRVVTMKTNTVETWMRFVCNPLSCWWENALLLFARYPFRERKSGCVCVCDCAHAHVLFNCLQSTLNNLKMCVNLLGMDKNS